MQAHSEATSSGSMAGNMAMRSWLRPELAVGLGVDDAVGPQHGGHRRGVHGVDEVDGAHHVAALLRVLHEGPGEAGLLGPGVEDLGRAVAARGRPLQPAVGVHPVELLGQQVDGGQGRRVVGLVQHRVVDRRLEVEEGGDPAARGRDPLDPLERGRAT